MATLIGKNWWNLTLVIDRGICRSGLCNLSATDLQGYRVKSQVKGKAYGFCTC